MIIFIKEVCHGSIDGSGLSIVSQTPLGTKLCGGFLYLSHIVIFHLLALLCNRRHLMVEDALRLRGREAKRMGRSLERLNILLVVGVSLNLW